MERFVQEPATAEPDQGEPEHQEPEQQEPAEPETKEILCPRCTGGGMVAAEEDCPECCGQPVMNCDGYSMVCEVCHGTGRKNVPCPDCGGKGCLEVSHA